MCPILHSPKLQKEATKNWCQPWHNERNKMNNKTITDLTLSNVAPNSDWSQSHSAAIQSATASLLHPADRCQTGLVSNDGVAWVSFRFASSISSRMTRTGDISPSRRSLSINLLNVLKSEKRKTSESDIPKKFSATWLIISAYKNVLFYFFVNCPIAAHQCSIWQTNKSRLRRKGMTDTIFPALGASQMRSFSAHLNVRNHPSVDVSQGHLFVSTGHNCCGDHWNPWWAAFWSNKGRGHFCRRRWSNTI